MNSDGEKHPPNLTDLILQTTTVKQALMLSSIPSIYYPTLLENFSDILVSLQPHYSHPYQLMTLIPTSLWNNQSLHKLHHCITNICTTYSVFLGRSLGISLPTRDYSAMSTFLIVTTSSRGATGIQWVEAPGAATHLQYLAQPPQQGAIQSKVPTVPRLRNCQVWTICWPIWRLSLHWIPSPSVYSCKNPLHYSPRSELCLPLNHRRTKQSLPNVYCHLLPYVSAPVCEHFPEDLPMLTISSSSLPILL